MTAHAGLVQQAGHGPLWIAVNARTGGGEVVQQAGHGPLWIAVNASTGRVQLTGHVDTG